MKFWIIEGAERWTSDTKELPEDIKAELARDGHAWVAGSLYLSIDTIRKMATVS